tara:strand:- start:437 stop:2431 length:1995 start_codon:yes stop_codon:yes gene_type:complete
MSVKLVKSSGRAGEMLQKIVVDPDKRYRVAGEVRGSQSGLAYIQVKTYANGKEVARHSTSRNKGTDWQEIEKVFSTQGVESIEILLRWRQKEEFMGADIEFRSLTLEEVPPLAHKGEEVPPRAVATFHSIGLYWKPEGGTSGKTVTVNYREKGADAWEEALPLWFDTTIHPDSASAHTAEYRGSIVSLDPGVTYEVQLALEGGPERLLEVDTWSEDFKIAQTITLPKESKDTFVITEGGSEELGYVLYEAAPGTLWDAENEASANMKIEASWVIVRGLTMKGSKNHGIVLGDVNHIVIDSCDISGWGETGSDGQAKNFNSAVFSGSRELETIVVQNCDLHDPRSDSNSWKEKRPGTNSFHPGGPQAVTFIKGKGNYVIRNNRIYSDLDHMFNDGMGEYSNSSFGGFPNRDSDIYDNYVSHCWDDALEIEGANMNVRVWNNYMDMTYGAIGGAATSLGPVYFYRNVYAVSRKHTGTDANSFRGHYLLKLGNKSSVYTRGKMFVFHNTTLQPFSPSAEWPDLSSGAQAGMVFTNKKNQQQNMTSRNNIFQMRKDSDWAIRDVQLTQNNDFDYDLYNGKVMARKGSEKNGIVGAPTYQRAADGRLWLEAGTLGYDAGERIPNFNDDYAGAAPDMGAVETDSNTPKPANWPDFPENYSPAEAATETAE